MNILQITSANLTKVRTTQLEFGITFTNSTTWNASKAFENAGNDYENDHLSR